MASAHKRPNGRWIGMYRDSNRKQKSAGTFATEAQALKAAKHAEALANPHFSGDGRPLGQEITDDRATVGLCRAAFEAVWEAAIPHHEYKILDCPRPSTGAESAGSPPP